MPHEPRWIGLLQGIFKKYPNGNKQNALETV